MKRIRPKIQELTPNEYLLLKQSFFLYHNDKDKDSFVCFGKYYSKLCELELIDGEQQITYTGRLLVKFLMARLNDV